MDPFTEKLLARTQARKAALTNKREEVARRSPAVNSPRRPLVENNPNINYPSTPTTTKPAVLRTPLKGTPVVVTSAPFAGGTPKSVFYEKYSKQASLKQKECFIELGEVKQCLKSTATTTKQDGVCVNNQEISKPKETKKLPTAAEAIENIQKASLTENTDSPSVKDRRAMYMKQVQVDLVTNKSTQEDEKKFNKQRIFPSVKEPRTSLASGRFFNDPRNIRSEATPGTEKADQTVPTKPPRTTVSKQGESVKEVPAKPPRSAEQMQAAAPPSKPPRAQVNMVSSVDIKLTKPEEVTTSTTVKRKAPAPPAEVKDAKKVVTESTCTNSLQKADAPSLSQNTDVPSSILKTNKGAVSKATKRCENEIKSDIPNKKSAIEGNTGIQSPKCNKIKSVKDVECLKSENLLSPNKDFLSTDLASPVAKESTPTQAGPNDNMKRTLKSQKISAISLGDVPVDENAHEITFNIDMTEFDEVLENEKESMFQMTYDERIVKAATKKTITEKPVEKDVNDHETSSIQALNKGVHRSGYHSIYSDQYAAVVTPKKVKSASTRRYTVHEKIQMFLEEAAYQQNIVLQASQAVNTCLAFHDGVSTGSSEEIEAERLLKFSTERRTACLNEVQKLKNGEDDEDVEMNEQNGEELPCKATFTVSEIKVPIDKKLIQNKNPLEPCIYSFICMVKHNPKQMYCTKAVTSDEIKNGCVIFDDMFEIKNVKPSFSLDISVFVLKTQLPSATPTNKHKRKTSMIAKSVLDSPKIKQMMSSGKKFCDNTSQAVTPGSTNGPVFRTSGFNLVSRIVINLGNVHNRRYNTTQVGDKSYLNGDLKVNISCNPEYFNEAKGFLTVFEDVGGLGDWLRYWCILDGNVLQYWKYPDEELIKPPIGSIDLGYCVSDSVTIVPRDICARPHTMQLVIEKPVKSTDRETLIAVNAGGKMVIKYMLSADTKADKQIWLSTLNNSLKDWRAWHSTGNLPTHNMQKKRSESEVIML